MNTNLKNTIAAATLALALGAGTSQAAEWKFSVTPYLWATDIGIDTKLNGRQIVDERIPVTDVVEDIDMIFQMRADAMYGTFGVAVDAFDVTMSDEKKGAALPQGAGTADLESEIGMTIVDVTGVYDPNGDRRGLALLGGTRIINNRAEIDATIYPTPGGTVPQSYESSETLVDALLGARFNLVLTPHWGVQMQADASTGGTDYTWSAGPMVGYSFGETGRLGLNAGYRIMQMDFQDDGGLDNTLTLSGFLLGLRASF